MFENLKIKSPRDYCIKRSGQNAYDLDCHKYVNCWHSNAVIQTCHPPSLVFNPKLGVCDWITSPGKYCTKYSNKFITFNMQFQILKLLTNSSDVFNNFFHKFFPQIFLSLTIQILWKHWTGWVGVYENWPFLLTKSTRVNGWVRQSPKICICNIWMVP